MSDEQPENRSDTRIDLGIYDRNNRIGITSAEIMALVLSVLWIAGISSFFLFGDSRTSSNAVDPLTFVIKLLAIFLPIAVIWVGAATARAARLMRTESARLQAAIDAMRHSYIEQAQSAGMGVRPSVEKKLDEIAEAQKKTDAKIAVFSSTRERPGEKAITNKPVIVSDSIDAVETEQTTLELGTRSAEIHEPVGIDDFIRALNFPENADDQAGFDALRLALKDRTIAKLIQSAQDVLTLLSQEGIYMDDLRPDRAKPEIWRNFAKGERGRGVAALGGVRDRSCLALTAGRMRQDTIFRDTAHHFLREFDKTFVEFEANANDEEISALADTRTARAFMLLGRVAGVFD